MTWTAERVETLKRLWAGGTSARGIADEMGGGLTRSAVIGKVHRLKLPAPVRQAMPKAAKAEKQKKLSALIKMAIVAPVSRQIPLFDLVDADCRQVTGSAGTLSTFCGHPKEFGAYCAYHARRNYAVAEA
jgi:GcrA cell cycle regulator